MISKMKQVRKFTTTYILPTLNYLILALTLYTAIAKLLLWDILNPLLNANVGRFLSLFGLDRAEVHIDTGAFTIWAARFLVVIALLLLATTVKYVRSRSFWLAASFFLAILIVAGLSRYWSVNVSYTDSRYLYFLAVGLGGLYIGLEFRESRLRVLLEVFAALIVLANLTTIIKYPDIAILKDVSRGDSWRGIFTWKMPTAEMMGFAAIMFLYRLANFKEESWFIRIYSVVFYGLAVFLLVEARSVTELIALIAVHLAFFLVILFVKWGHLLKPLHWWILGGATVSVFLIAWFGRSTWLGLFGRTAGLTGRMPLWEALIPYIQRRFFLGYGFGEAFWKNTPYAQNIWSVITWRPIFAHNGYVEAIVDTGIVGLVFWVSFLIQILYYSLRYLYGERKLSASIFFAWFVFVAVSNIANNHLGSYEVFTWFMLVTAFIFTFRNVLDRKPVLVDTTPKT